MTKPAVWRYDVVTATMLEANGEWVRYHDHLEAVRQLVAVCRQAVGYLDSAGCHAAARVIERAIEAEGSQA